MFLISAMPFLPGLRDLVSCQATSVSCWPCVPSKSINKYEQEEKGIWITEVSVEYSGIGFSQEGLDWLEWLEGRKIAFSKIFRRSTFHWPWVAPNFSFILPTWQNSFRNPTIQYQTQVPKTPWRAPWKRSVCQPLGQANPVWHVLGWRVINRKDDI